LVEQIMANISVVAPSGGRSHVRARPGLFRKVLEAIMESRQIKANREIVEIIARQGGGLRRE